MFNSSFEEMKTIFMDNTGKGIPGVEVYLDKNTLCGANRLGTLKADYQCGISYKKLKGRLSMERPDEISLLALSLGDLVKFVGCFAKKTELL